MRTIRLTAAALLGAALLPTMGTAFAAGETCQGQAATIVGTPGGQIVGTEGADVIVTNGATQVDALGGDDLVCATGGATGVVLGAGADTFVAEFAAYHQVVAGATDLTDTEADVIRSTSGYVVVSTGMAGQPNADTIDTAAATVRWNGTQTAPSSVRVTGGELNVTSTGDATMDARTGTMASPGTSLTYTGHFSEFSFTTAAEHGRFTFRGTDHEEYLAVDAPTTYDRDVTMGGGKDTYESNGLGGSASRVTGDGGRDRVSLDLHDYRVRANLGSSGVIATTAGVDTKARVHGFEDVTLSAKRADVTGTNRGNQIDLIACQAHVRAKKGKDRISVSDGLGGVWTAPTCGTYRAVVFGGRGNDTVLGGPGNDRLIGGWGKDIVKGSAGRDVCQAEKIRTCEKRI